MINNFFKVLTNRCLLLFVAALAGAVCASAEAVPPPVDVSSWDLATWRAWPFDYEELSVRQAPLATAESSDWVHAGDSWVAENKRESPGPAKPLPAAYAELRITSFYLTGGGNAAGPNRVFCASAVPDGVDGPFPVLFVFHGGGGHASGALALALARNNPGFATVAIDYNGQFMPSKQPVTRWTTQTEELRARRLDLDPNPLNFPMYHNVQAARRVLDWVEEQPWADKARFGASGVSFGGWVSYVLAGVDDRIASVVAQVSAAGTRGMRGRSSQPHDWEPREQVETWIRHADPASYASATRAPVFMRLAANDRHFWLDGAAYHRALFPGRVEWLIVPNSDHGNGGPELPDPHGLWHRAIHFNGTPFPSFGKAGFSDNGNSVAVAVESARPLKSVHLAWSPGTAVSPARYWRWIAAKERNGIWAAELPEGHAGLGGAFYFTAVDVDGRAVSSDLARKPGAEAAPALEWRDGCLWDTEAGAAAWRSNHSFDRCRIEEAAPGRVRVSPLKAGSKAAFFTNSFSLTDAARRAHRGIRIGLDGNGSAGRVRILLARDYTSLDEQVFAAEVELSGGMSDAELPWEAFKPYGRGTVGGLFPVNALVVQSEGLSAEGIGVGAVRWLD
jgi:dienelactone hydrolase